MSAGMVRGGVSLLGRKKISLTKPPTPPPAVDFHRLEAQFFNGPAQLFDRLFDIRQINPGAADEAIVALNVFGDRVVVSARELSAQFSVTFVNQRTIIGN